MTCGGGSWPTEGPAAHPAAAGCRQDQEVLSSLSWVSRVPAIASVIIGRRRSWREFSAARVSRSSVRRASRRRSAVVRVWRVRARTASSRTPARAARVVRPDPGLRGIGGAVKLSTPIAAHKTHNRLNTKHLRTAHQSCYRRLQIPHDPNKTRQFRNSTPPPSNHISAGHVIYNFFHNL